MRIPIPPPSSLSPKMTMPQREGVGRSTSWFLFFTMLLSSACLGPSVASSNPAVQTEVARQLTQIAAGSSNDSSLVGESSPSGLQATATPTLEPTLAPTEPSTLTPTITLTPTAVSVTMTAGQDLSCVMGPQWILYEWVAPISKGETVVLLARATSEWEEYYYIRTNDGKECWAYGGSSTKNGDVSTLPVKDAPPLPEVTYTIENKTMLGIENVFIRKKGETSWGANRLSAYLTPESYPEEINITAGFYDVKILDEKGGILYVKYGAAIGANPTSRQIVVNTQVKAHFTNKSILDVCEVYLTYDSTWFTGGTFVHSPSDGVVAPGEEMWFTVLAGFYTVDFYQCGTKKWVASSPGRQYIGPAVFEVG